VSAVNPFDVAQLALLGEAVECFTDVAVFVWDDDRNYVAVNQAACRMVGRTREELLAMKVGDMTENRASPLFDQVLRGDIHTGTHVFEGGQLEFLTCRTRVAGLPYMVSICWRSEPR
jgi:PAS domain S-box-containing protein